MNKPGLNKPGWHKLGWRSEALGLVILMTLMGLSIACGDTREAPDLWIGYLGKQGPGAGKNVVLIAADDEYRSEELIPQLAKILSVHHGFRCTVLFAMDRARGVIDPEVVDDIPGLEALEEADLMVLFARFRELPDSQMKRIMDFVESGRGVVALRTATHAFRYQDRIDSPYARYSFDSPEPKGGFGRQILGETWVAHYGKHQEESTRGLIAEGAKDHPIVQGCQDIWGPSDVYAITTLSGDSRPLILGQVLTGMSSQDAPHPEKELVPVAWTKTHQSKTGEISRVFTTTMGHAEDLLNEGFRRLVVNACYWGAGMEDQIPALSQVDLVGAYTTSPIGFGGHRRGIKPQDHLIP